MADLDLQLGVESGFEQRMRLLDIQRFNTRVFKDSGITEHLEQFVGDSPISDLSLVLPVVSHRKTDNNGIVQIYGLRVSTPFYQGGKLRRKFDRVGDLPVAGIEGDHIELFNDFTLDAAYTVVNAVKGLREARENGFLPDLSSDYTTIYKRADNSTSTH